MMINSEQMSHSGDGWKAPHDNDNHQTEQKNVYGSGRHLWTRSFNRSATLLPQIGKLIRVRYGGPCNDHDAIVYYEAALPYLIDLAGAHGNLLDSALCDPAGLDLCKDGLRLVRSMRRYTPGTSRWVRWCTPFLAANEDITGLERAKLYEWYDHHDSRFGHEPFGPDGRALGRKLRMTAAEMRAGDIRFVSPIDRTAGELAAERRVSDAAYQRRRRDAAGARAQSSSSEKLKLWSVVGISRRQYYKLKAAGELPAVPKIPRDADPAPYIAAWATVYRSTAQVHPRAGASGLI